MGMDHRIGINIIDFLGVSEREAAAKDFDIGDLITKG